MKNRKQKEPKVQPQQKKRHDPARTEANKAANIAKEKARQEWLAKNKVQHGAKRALERQAEALWLKNPQVRTVAYDAVGMDNPRDYYIRQGFIKPKGGAQLLAAMEQAGVEKA